MIDTTTPKDLARKIEWVGLRSLSRSERELLEGNLEKTSRFLPRVLAIALWSYYGHSFPDGLATQDASESLQSYKEREASRSLVSQIMAGHRENSL